MLSPPRTILPPPRTMLPHQPRLRPCPSSPRVCEHAQASGPLLAPSTKRGAADARSPGGGCRRQSFTSWTQWSARGGRAQTPGAWRRCSACGGGPPRRRPRLFSPAVAPGPEQEVLGTGLLFEFYMKDLIAFLLYMQGPNCILCLDGMAQVIQATKQSISASSPNTCKLTNRPLKSETSLYDLRYLRWKSKSEQLQATKHTLRTCLVARANPIIPIQAEIS
jgi:hypothetical protein